MDIKHWSRTFKSAVNKKFPKPLSTEERMLALYRQIADASAILTRSKGHDVGSRYEENDPNADFKYRMACVFIDLFVLSEDIGIDFDMEFGKALAWFEAENGRGV